METLLDLRKPWPKPFRSDDGRYATNYDQHLETMRPYKTDVDNKKVTQSPTDQNQRRQINPYRAHTS